MVVFYIIRKNNFIWILNIEPIQKLFALYIKLDNENE